MDDFLRAAAAGPFDFVRGSGVQLPMLVIAEMLGVPARTLRDFKRWSTTWSRSSAAWATASSIHLAHEAVPYSPTSSTLAGPVQADEPGGLLLQSRATAGRH